MNDTPHASTPTTPEEMHERQSLHLLRVCDKRFVCLFAAMRWHFCRWHFRSVHCSPPILLIYCSCCLYIHIVDVFNSFGEKL